MDDSRERKIMNVRGFSLIEMIVVVAILSILLTITGLSFKAWYDRYKAESQIRILHADLMQARLTAMQKNRQQFVVITDGSYQLVEDVNENGTNDDPVREQKLLQYPATSPVTVIMDTKGLISTATSSLVNSLSIKFDTGSASPEYDCIQLYATRISLGRYDGTQCIPR